MHGIMQEQAILLLWTQLYSESEDGTIDPKKAISIAESFEVSRQFWSYLVEQKISSRKNLSKVFRISALFGVKNVEYLKKRFEALQKPTFKDMVFSTDCNWRVDAASNGRQRWIRKVAATSGGWYWCEFWKLTKYVQSFKWAWRCLNTFQSWGSNTKTKKR
jgi:hypothetical protein